MERKHYVLHNAKELFNSEKFTIDGFITEQRQLNIPLENLLVELKKFGSSLENELLELINKDYTDFVNLSANLSGIDKVIENLRVPMQQMRKEIQSVKDIVSLLRSDFQEKLERKKELSQKKKLLTLFTSLNSIICKIENLLFVNDQFSHEGGQAVQALTAPGFDNNLVENKEEISNLIQRVANDFNQLNFYVSSSSQHPFVKTLEFRIHRIESIMKDILEKLLEESISLKKDDVIANCLRTYVAIDKIHEAEDLFKLRFVIPFLSSVITPEEIEKSPKTVYDRIIAWIENDCSHLFEVNRQVKGFDFLSNSIFSAFVSLSQNTKLYGPIGIPDIFHENFLVAMNFINRFEYFFSSISDLRRFRSSLSYIEFMRRWNLSIYFGMRFQEIIDEVETTYASSPYEGKVDLSVGFEYPITEKLYSWLKRAWSRSIFLDLLTDSFFKLSLQLLARHAHWLLDGLKTTLTNDKSTDLFMLLPPHLRSYVDDHHSNNINNNNNNMSDISNGHGNSNSNSGSDIKATTEDLDWAKWINNEEAISSLYYDTHFLVFTMATNFPKFIISETQNSLPAPLYDIIKESFSDLSDLQIINDIIAKLLIKKSTEVCILALQPVKGIMQTFRMTNKATPTRHSFYVNKIFDQLRKLLAFKAISKLPTPVKRSFSYSIISNVTDKFLEWVVEMLDTVEKQSALLLKMRSTRLKANEPETSIKGDDKIAVQLDLDVKEYAKEISSFGFEPSADFANFNTLCESFKHKLPQ